MCVGIQSVLPTSFSEKLIQFSYSKYLFTEAYVSFQANLYRLKIHASLFNFFLYIIHRRYFLIYNTLEMALGINYYQINIQIYV